MCDARDETRGVVIPLFPQADTPRGLGAATSEDREESKQEKEKEQKVVPLAIEMSLDNIKKTGTTYRGQDVSVKCDQCRRNGTATMRIDSKVLRHIRSLRGSGLPYYARVMYYCRYCKVSGKYAVAVTCR